MPLEGLWWAEDTATFTSARDTTRWDRTLMIMVPDWITTEMFDAAVEKIGPRERVAAVRLETLSEGRCVQGSDVPGSDVPGSDVPGSDVPGSDVPGSDVPGYGIFTSPISDQPAPGSSW
nr:MULTISPECIES: hypothetical protein [unclassified Pseudonocardia]